MAVFKFNKNYRDKELKRVVKAYEPVEMTIKRADEVVKNIRSQSETFKDYEDFGYERIDNKDDDEAKRLAAEQKAKEEAEAKAKAEKEAAAEKKEETAEPEKEDKK